MILEIPDNTDPIVLFKQWYDSAQASGERDVTEMALATAGHDGLPAVRIVLLKSFDEAGFCFFTNYDSKKGKTLLSNPQAGLCFHWLKPYHRQIRIQGPCLKVSREESEEYFRQRPRGSQIGAWASPQSQPIASRSLITERVAELEEKFKNDEIPLPPHWGGFRVQPLHMEFWQEQDFRLHDRFAFSRRSLSDPWQRERLAP